MLFGILFSCLFNVVFELSCWFLSSKCRLFKLFIVSRRIVLRLLEPDCCDWSVRSGVILGRVFKCLFKLFIGDIFIVCILDKLLELSCWLISGLDGIHILLGMSRGLLLRDNGSHSCDG